MWILLNLRTFILTFFPVPIDFIHLFIQFSIFLLLIFKFITFLMHSFFIPSIPSPILLFLPPFHKHLQNTYYVHQTMGILTFVFWETGDHVIPDKPLVRPLGHASYA